MIDLETMGTRYDAPVVAIGAVFFNPDTSELGESFYANIDLEDACRFGKATGGTIAWWLRQSDAARGALTRPGSTSSAAFSAFRAFVESHTREPVVWGNGATFDISILEFAFPATTGRDAPWKFWNVRDCRTVKDLAAPFDIEVGPLAGVAHNALDDAKHQAGWVSAMWQALRVK